MTIHAAKGLEFPAVFVVGLEENLFPSQLSVNSRDDLEEERRLFYVAITRAEKKLTLSYANSRFRWGNLISNEPSRFIEELDMQHIEETGVRKPNFDFVFNNPEERWDSNAVPKKGSIFSEKPAGLKNVSSLEVKNFVGDDTSDIQAGMEVEHQRFGVGKVLFVEGNGADRKALIFFQGVGQKQLLLKFAKLKILS
jgi:DNA helicase-2/ATP-dependent DNA helicase PcrA